MRLYQFRLGCRLGRRLGPLVALAMFTGAASCGPGCEFFEELQSAESASTTGTGTSEGGSGSDGGGPCEILADDRCEDQDTLLRCDPETGVLTEYDCTAVCGSYVNFSCVLATAIGQHACWCVEPGFQKVYSCTELEGCLKGCAGAIDSACSDECFTRTIESTIRTYGALVDCAHSSCQDDCVEEPGACGTCIDSAIAEGSHGCGLERSVCDEDQNDEWMP